MGRARSRLLRYCVWPANKIRFVPRGSGCVRPPDHRSTFYRNRSFPESKIAGLVHTLCCASDYHAGGAEERRIDDTHDRLPPAPRCIHRPLVPDPPIARLRQEW